MLRTEESTDRLTDTEVVFIGTSRELRDVREWALRQGFQPVDRLNGREPRYAVVDEDVLDGRCDARQAMLMQQVRGLGIRCVPPNQARTELAVTLGTG